MGFGHADSGMPGPWCIELHTGPASTQTRTENKKRSGFTSPDHKQLNIWSRFHFYPELLPVYFYFSKQIFEIAKLNKHFTILKLLKILTVSMDLPSLFANHSYIAIMFSVPLENTVQNCVLIIFSMILYFYNMYVSPQVIFNIAFHVLNFMQWLSYCTQHPGTLFVCFTQFCVF